MPSNLYHTPYSLDTPLTADARIAFKGASSAPKSKRYDNNRDPWWRATDKRILTDTVRHERRRTDTIHGGVSFVLTSRHLTAWARTRLSTVQWCLLRKASPPPPLGWGVALLTFKQHLLTSNNCNFTYRKSLRPQIKLHDIEIEHRFKTITIVWIALVTA